MKRIAFIIALATGVAGCTPKGVDIDIDDGRYTLNISSGENILRRGFVYYLNQDSIEFYNTIPGMAFHLSAFLGGGDGDAYRQYHATTMFWVDKEKQEFLPTYHIMIRNREPEKAHDFTKLFQALVDRELLVADTTYEPLQLLVLADTARYRASIKPYEDSASLDIAIGIVDELQREYRLPVSLDESIPYDLPVESRWFNDRKADSLWLDNSGFRLVPDPQGRQMRIITFNRHKGKI